MGLIGNILVAFVGAVVLIALGRVASSLARLLFATGIPAVAIVGLILMLAAAVVFARTRCRYSVSTRCADDAAQVQTSPVGVSRGRVGGVTLGFRGAIFDVDGVLVASPHERAWRESLRELITTEWRTTGYSAEQFTTAVYQEHVAGQPRLSGTRAVLDYFHIPDADGRAIEYAERKQRRMEELLEAGEFVAFPDALRFALVLEARGVRLAAASSSKNANVFLARIRLDVFAREENLREPPIAPGRRLLDLFDANVCGRDLPHGKPHPLIFQLAAEELGLPPSACVVVEDASVGIRAAKAGGMAALGVARLGDEALLAGAGADLVVSTLDEVALERLAAGRLERRPTSA